MRTTTNLDALFRANPAQAHAFATHGTLTPPKRKAWRGKVEKSAATLRREQSEAMYAAKGVCETCWTNRSLAGTCGC